MIAGGDLAFPQLGRKLKYQPGDAVIFRGAELDHFVCHWSGYRVFQLFTNHQPVYNYVNNVIRKTTSEDTAADASIGGPDMCETGESKSGGVGKDVDDEKEEESYAPCYAEPDSAESEDLDEVDIHGPAYIPHALLTHGSSTSASTEALAADRGRVYPKRQKIEGSE